MAGGDVQFRVFQKVATQVRKLIPTEVPTFGGIQCCFTLPVFGTVSEDDYYKNDKHSIVGRYDINYYNTVDLIIQKNVSGVWVDQVTLTNDDYGSFYPLGQFTDSDVVLNYVAFEADWKKILTLLGSGMYRFKFFETDFLANDTETIYPFDFCLNEYSAELADETIRFDFWSKGFRGDQTDDTNIWDFTTLAAFSGGDGWFNQIRLPDSEFGQNKSNYTKSYTIFENGSLKYTQNEQVVNYECILGYFPAILHDFIKTDILQSDLLSVTDYNSNAQNVITDKFILPTGNYEPEWKYGKKEAPVTLTFDQDFQNRNKKRC